MKRLIVADENAYAVVSYDYRSPSGNALQQDAAEVGKMVDGKIVSLTIILTLLSFAHSRVDRRAVKAILKNLLSY